MRLTDLEPKWLYSGGARVGFIFRCPLPQLNYAQRMVWLAELLGARVERDIRDPSDLPRLVVTFRQ